MSARPRPVTATFRPRSLEPVTGVRTRSYSLSSGASTESLVSVLDHDSCESLPDSETDSRPEPKSNTISSRTDTKCKPSTCSNTTYTATRPSDQCASVGGPGTSWETWMVDKAKELRLKQKCDTREQKQKLQLEKQKVEQQKEKLKVGEERLKEWIAKKNDMEKVQKKRVQQEEQAKREIQEMKKEQVQEKASKKYGEWKEQQLNRDKERKRQEAEQKRKEEEEKEERQRKCQTAYEEWGKKARNRPRSVHSSLGYTSGKLTGYYDKTANPTPSFYNPVPWHPVEIPTVKVPKRRSKSARRWNPNKYF